MRRTNKGALLHSLRPIMAQKQITRSELARRTGLAYTSLWRFETLRMGATDATAQDIARALRVPVSHLKKNIVENCL